ncbi:MAG: hypothetical protein IPK07_11720 [Deltaproteobacteria bacterium]|jgi:hypothetical protein|nr:hypothetical protein [Deltaproteobacteria bacterium]
MNPRMPRFFRAPSAARFIACISLGCVALAPPARAAEKRARLIVDVKVIGSYSVVGSGQEKESGNFANGYHLATIVKSDGEPSAVNPKDPHYAAQMTATAAAVEKRVAEVEGRDTPAKKMSPADAQKILREKQVACKGDQTCLMQVAIDTTRMMNQVDFGAGSAPVTSNVGTAPVEESGDERFLSYFGFDDCGAAMRVTADFAVTGQYDDVQGPVPYSSSLKGDSPGDPSQLALVCTTTNLVFDAKTHTLFTDGLSAPIATGTKRVTDRGHMLEGPANLWQSPGWEWVSEQLRQAPAAGQRSTTIQLTQMPGGVRIVGKLSGEVKIELAWKLEELAR